MNSITTYETLNTKRNFFNNGNTENFQIDSKRDLDRWFKEIENMETDYSENDATAFIYRGIGEAKYKLYTSAQRLWLNDEMQQWSKKDYLDFIKHLIDNANANKLINKVFEFYNYSIVQRDFPILSLLQHYGAPTPLMDWTYNNYVAFYFATEKIKYIKNPLNEIENYFSIYRINKRNYFNEFLNIIDIFPDNRYPSIQSFKSIENINSPTRGNFIFYISDFEESGVSKGISKSRKKLLIRTHRPLTLTYNQNIIPQEGLFIFNPSSNKSLEDIFNINNNDPDSNLNLKPFDCYNINKNLGQYLKRKIAVKIKINNSFIYPNLINEANYLKEKTLDELI